MNISRSNIKIDLKKSKGSYLYDTNTNSFYLDLMNMYSSLPLGYNSKAFNKNFKKEILECSNVKITNCEYNSFFKESFEEEFVSFVNVGKYNFSHFACTGALAVEQAIKAAMEYSGKKNSKVVYFSKSFHGIMGYSNYITDRFGSTKIRLDDFHNLEWFKVSSIEELEILFKSNHNISCLIIEPVRCTQGDLYYDNSEIDHIFNLCKKYNIISISDEIQTGFGTTGEVWYTGNKSDIIVFGKKSQVSGFLTTNDIGSKLTPIKYCITWDGDVLDMIRSKYIIKYIKNKNLLDEVKKKSLFFISELKKLKYFKNVRGAGFLIAFDLENENLRNDFYSKCLKNKILVNLTGEKSIRLRPNLDISKKDIKKSIKIFKQIINGK